MKVKDDRSHNQIYKPSYTTLIRLERRADYIISQFDTCKPSDILEIGCGMGIMANMIAQKTSANILAIDLCVPFIEYAQRNFNEQISLLLQWILVNPLILVAAFRLHYWKWHSSPFILSY